MFDMNRCFVMLISTIITASIGIACTAVWKFESSPANSQFRDFDGVLRVPGTYLAPWNSGLTPLLEQVRSGKYYLEIYDSEGEIWSEFAFGGGDSELEVVGNPEVNPFAFHSDYDLLDFRITRVSRSWIEIIVNEETKERKYVRGFTSSGILAWDQYLGGKFAVDVHGQWILDQAAGTRIFSPEYTEHRVEPVEVRGDWLKVRCVMRKPSDSNIGDRDPAGESIEGWVKWRNGDDILITVFYFA
ncbi:MAG: hypothetical protein J5I65_13580 [Aridibacter famidurans]|nr:hypothetical protein [Aridibacter famidurans]